MWISFPTTFSLSPSSPFLSSLLPSFLTLFSSLFPFPFFPTTLFSILSLLSFPLFTPFLSYPFISLPLVSYSRHPPHLPPFPPLPPLLLLSFLIFHPSFSPHFTSFSFHSTYDRTFHRPTYTSTSFPPSDPLISPPEGRQIAGPRKVKVTRLDRHDGELVMQNRDTIKTRQCDTALPCPPTAPPSSRQVDRWRQVSINAKVKVGNTWPDEQAGNLETQTRNAAMTRERDTALPCRALSCPAISCCTLRCSVLLFHSLVSPYLT